MIIVAHNTMSYRSPKQWWLKPFSFLAKCQRLDYKTLHEKYNVNAFDLRIFYDKKQNLEFRHGLFRYSSDDINDILEYCELNNIRLRVLFEYRKTTEKRKDLELLKSKFKDFCKEIESKYKILFYGGYITDTNEVLYDFKTDIEEIGFYSSVTSPFKSSKLDFLRRIDDLWPWLYAKNHNKKNMEKNMIKYGNKYVHISYDFVDLR